MLSESVCECVSAHVCLQSRWIWGWAGILEDRVFYWEGGRSSGLDPKIHGICVRAFMRVCLCVCVYTRARVYVWGGVGIFLSRC